MLITTNSRRRWIQYCSGYLLHRFIHILVWKKAR